MSESRLRLRPVRQADLAYFDNWTTAEADPYNFFGFRPEGSRRKQFAEDGLISDEASLLLIEVGVVVVGDVGWHRVQYGPAGVSDAVNIGIRLLPQHRGRGYGAAAQRALADYLFATQTINRVEASTDIENIPEQKALARAGFVREGVLRGAQWRAGEWHDLVVFSRLRDES